MADIFESKRRTVEKCLRGAQRRDLLTQARNPAIRAVAVEYALGDRLAHRGRRRTKFRLGCGDIFLSDDFTKLAHSVTHADADGLIARLTLDALTVALDGGLVTLSQRDPSSR
jgi:hypothetical protein